MDPVSLKIMSWNVNGLRNRVTDVHYFTLENNVDIITLQETGDRKGDLLKLNGCKGFHLCSGEHIRRVSTYIKNSIPSELIENPSKVQGIESVCIKVYLREGELNIVNLYISGGCFDLNSLPDCMFLDSTLAVGDFNARHPRLETMGRVNNNGIRFLQFLQDHPDAYLLGNKEVTHVKEGRLDYACMISSQGVQGECEVIGELVSDHFALYIHLPLGKRQVKYKRKRLKLNKDSTDLFIQNIGLWYRNYSPVCADSFYLDLVGEMERNLIKSTEREEIEKRHGAKKNYYTNDKMLKGWTQMLRAAHKEWVRNGRREEDKAILLEVAKICGQVRKEAREKYWQDFAQHIGESKNLKDIWQDINRIRGKKSSFISHSHPEEANKLIANWATAASINSLPHSTREALDRWHNERRGFISASLNTCSVTCVDITKDELLYAIKKGRSTAPGEDGVTYDILNCLAGMENSPLLDLFNMSYKEGKLPTAWKKAVVIPVPKTTGGYRPVSLTSCFSKMMERILLNRLLYIVGDKLSCNLFGFLKGKSTSDCVIKCLSNDAVRCRVFVDLQGAFDKAHSEVIMYEVAALGVSGKLLNWIGDYLHDRRACVWYQGCLSEERKFELGTPQGGVLSPMLFNILMNKIASNKYPQRVVPIIYADDILIQGNSVNSVQSAWDSFSILSQKLGLVINEEKTKFQCKGRGTESLFLNGKSIEKVSKYKYLGMYIGFTTESKDAEVNHVLTQCKARLQPLKALACCGKGAGVPVLRLIYITTIRSLIDYVLSCVGEGRLRKIEILQNEAMRIILGCQKNTMIEIMKLELGLQSIVQRVNENNIVAAVRLMRGNSGDKLLQDTHDGLQNIRTFWRQGKRGYMKGLINNIEKYNVIDWCTSFQKSCRVPPWEEHEVELDIMPLTMRKSLHEPGQLRALFSYKICNIPKVNTLHVYCDGSVVSSGRAGCGIFIRQHTTQNKVLKTPKLDSG